MDKKEDICTRKDVEKLVDQFYGVVIKDDLIGPFFNTVAKVNWDLHLPQMYDFWESTLFNTHQYRGNPMQDHIKLHMQSALDPAHFERWLSLFNHTINALFEGPKAELAKTRASSIATVIQVKIGVLSSRR